MKEMKIPIERPVNFMEGENGMLLMDITAQFEWE